MLKQWLCSSAMLEYQVLINVLGCLFQFLKDISIHPPHGSSYGHMPRSRASLPNNRSQMLPFHCRYYRCKHSGKQHILSTTAEQKLPIFDIYSCYGNSIDLCPGQQVVCAVPAKHPSVFIGVRC